MRTQSAAAAPPPQTPTFGICQTQFEGGFCTSGTCGDDADCGAGNTCVNEYCYRSCTQDSGCLPGTRCTGNIGPNRKICLPSLGAEAGEACEDNTDCRGGSCATEEQGYPGGACQVGCQIDADCGPTAYCMPGQQRCAPRCDGAGESCRDGYTCEPLTNTVGDTRRACLRRAGPRDRDIGDACDDSEQCRAGDRGFCVTNQGRGWPRGYCLEYCGADGACPEGSRCSAFDANYTNRVNVCLKGCEVDADCGRPGYRCVDQDQDGVTECRPVGEGGGAIGAPCYDLSQCQGGAAAYCSTEDLDPEYRDGYCMRFGCQNNADCGAGNHCILVQGMNGGYCMRSCLTGADCPREGYGCFDVDYDGRAECAPGGGGGTTPQGAPCVSAADCAGGERTRCMTNSSATKTACSMLCNNQGDCASDQLCLFAQGASVGLCANRCEDSSDCYLGSECFEISGQRVCNFTP